MASLSKVASGGKKTKKAVAPGVSAVLTIENRKKLELRTVPMTHIMPNPDPELQQPRTEFDEEMIEELAQSMKEVGLLQPLLVSEADPSGKDEGKYYIQDGECRWRAAKKIGLTELAVYVNPRKLSKEELLLVQISSNEQRNPLKMFELALSIKRLLNMKLTLVEIADRMGKPRGYVTDINRLNSAPEYLCDYFRRTKFRDTNSMGLLITSEARNPERFKALFQKHLDEDTEQDHVTRKECSYIRDVVSGVREEVPEVSEAPVAQNPAQVPTNTAPAPVATTETAPEQVSPPMSEETRKAIEAAQKRAAESQAELERYYEEEAKDPDVRNNPFGFYPEEDEVVRYGPEEEATEAGKAAEAEAKHKKEAKSKPVKQSRWELPEGALMLNNFQALCYRAKVRFGDMYRHGTLMSVVTLHEKDKQAFLYQGKVVGVSNNQIVSIEGSVMADLVRCDDDREEAA